MARHVALLRGINVGGNNKVPMKALSALFERAGCTAVVTYIQSGNVVFEASAKVARALPGAIETAYGVPVVLRTAEEIAAVVKKPPFEDAERLYVMFLADTPSAARVAALDAARSPGDSFVVRGREIYLSLPTGVAKTKLTNAYFDRALATVSTARNWRTVLKLVALAQQPSP